MKQCIVPLSVSALGETATRRKRGSNRRIHSPVKFSNWRNPSFVQLVQEFEIEHEIKGYHCWKDLREFLQAVAESTCEKITPEMDATIGYRSHTRTRDQLFALIKTYKSYPEFRNKATLLAIYEGYEKSLPMDRPLVVESLDGSRRVFSGNTRMDAARHLGIDPEVLVVKTTTPYVL